MRVVVQRSKEASVLVADKTVGKIDNGYVLFVGFTNFDNVEIVRKMAKKIVDLRIFGDENGKMNLDIKSVGGSVLSVSQFTLYASLNGRRPSFTKALSYDEALSLYNCFNEELRSYGITVETGEFGAKMEVALLNDGPITITIDSKEDL